MKFVFFVITLIVTSFSLAAEKAVIQQMKGRRAIVQFEKDIPFSVGQKIYLNSDDGGEFGVSKVGRNPMERKNSIEMAVSITSTDTKPATMKYALSGTYGWNMGQYEFGPLGAFESSKQGSISSSEISGYRFGGFFDYNFVANKPGEDFIFGVYGTGAIGSSKISTSSKSVTAIEGGGFIKWFFFSPMLAARLNVFYSNEKQDSTARNTTGVKIGLSNYF